MKEQVLREELKNCFDAWGEDFDVDIQQDYYWKGYTYFAVGVSHKHLGHDYDFTARVGDDDKCEIEMGEDSWHPLSMGNVFAVLWFETAAHRET